MSSVDLILSDFFQLGRVNAALSQWKAGEQLERY